MAAQLRWDSGRAQDAAGAPAQSAVERCHRDRGRHGHGHPVPQPAGGREGLHPSPGPSGRDGGRPGALCPRPGLSDRGRDRHPGGRAPEDLPDRRREPAPAGALRGGAGGDRGHRAALPGLGRTGDGADRRPVQCQEAPHDRGLPRRVGPRVPDPFGHSPALQPGGPGSAHVAPVCDHRPGAELSGQHEPDRHQRSAPGHGPAGDSDASGWPSAPRPSADAWSIGWPRSWTGCTCWTVC